MRSITNVTMIDAIRELWPSVFLCNNPFTFPFTSWIKDLIVLYPTYGYHLEEDQWEALRAASESVGEHEFFLGTIEYEGDFLGSGDWFLCNHPTYSQYRDIPLVLENAALSVNGTWGALVSHEDHALVGGSIEFISVLRSRYSRWRSDSEDLFHHWSELKENSWVEGLRPYMDPDKPSTP